MKKQLMRVAKTTTGNIIKTILFSGTLTITTATLHAQALKTASQETASPVKSAMIKHIGNDNESMYFQLLLNNETGEKFYLTVKDQDGIVLFQDVYNDKKFDKKFRLTKGETEKVTFLLRSAKDNATQSFEINSNTRMVEEIVVKRM